MDTGTYDVDFGHWEFYAVTRRGDGADVRRLFESGRAGVPLSDLLGMK